MVNDHVNNICTKVHQLQRMFTLHFFSNIYSNSVNSCPGISYPQHYDSGMVMHMYVTRSKDLASVPQNYKM